jgi:hypothetical protein
LGSAEQALSPKMRVCRAFPVPAAWRPCTQPP